MPRRLPNRSGERAAPRHAATRVPASVSPVSSAASAARHSASRNARASSRLSGPVAITSRRRSAETASASAGSAARSRAPLDRLEQTVALAYQAVEVRQRLHPVGALLAIVGDDGEPEPELGEPHCRGAPVHAEQVALEDAAAVGGRRPARRPRERGQPVERTQQEGAGSGRRVQQRHGGQDGTDGSESRSDSRRSASPSPQPRRLAASAVSAASRIERTSAAGV